jgi:hypothetical protein
MRFSPIITGRLLRRLNATCGGRWFVLSRDCVRRVVGLVVGSSLAGNSASRSQSLGFLFERRTVRYRKTSLADSALGPGSRWLKEFATPTEVGSAVLLFFGLISQAFAENHVGTRRNVS